MKRFEEKHEDLAEEDHETLVFIGIIILTIVVAMIAGICMYKFSVAAMPTEEEWGSMNEKMYAISENPKLLLETKCAIRIYDEKIEVKLEHLRDSRYTLTAVYDKSFNMISAPSESGDDLGGIIIDTVILSISAGGIFFLTALVIVVQKWNKAKKDKKKA